MDLDPTLTHQKRLVLKRTGRSSRPARLPAGGDRCDQGPPRGHPGGRRPTAPVSTSAETGLADYFRAII